MAEEPKNVAQGLYDRAIAAISELAKAAMAGAPPWLKAVIFAAALSPIAVIVLGFGFVYLGVPLWLVVIFILVGILPAYVLVFYLAPKAGSLAAGRVVWSRAVPKSEDLQLHILGQQLEQIRQRALEHLKIKKPELEDKNIRANVFLPNYRDAGHGYAFRLRMPEPLRKRMDHPPEWEVSFRPGEGATGVVFLEGTRRITCLREFQLTDEQKKVVHKDLKWFVTLPLNDPEDGITLGVLNIDGLEYDFDEAALTGMADSLSAEILAFARELGKQSKVRLELHLAESDA